MPTKKKKQKKIRVKLRSYDHRQLDRSMNDIVEIAKGTGARLSGPIPLRTKIGRYTVMRSPHVHSKARDQFEDRTHARILDIHDPTLKTIDQLKLLQVPPGVDITVKT